VPSGMQSNEGVDVTCNGPGQRPNTNCSNPAEWGDLCRAHGQQRKRHPDRPLKPLRREARARLDATVLVHMTPKLKAEAKRAAEGAGVTESEWWREAGEQRLLGTETHGVTDLKDWGSSIEPGDLIIPGYRHVAPKGRKR
jgi:hypothetical protein